ncbi:MAG: YraN family protein [Burkholderiaceae bacterium]
MSGSEWSSARTGTTTTRSAGRAGEDRALAHLQDAGLSLVARNFKSPGRGGGEVDLIMREPDGTLVFVEVRQRSHMAFGGAAASVGWAKQRRVIFAARHYLQRLRQLPPCRFDVVALQSQRAEHGAEPHGSPEIQWIRGAFDATGYS